MIACWTVAFSVLAFGDAQSSVYIGKIERAPGGAKVGFVTTGDAVLAYACAKTSSANSKISRWWWIPTAADAIQMTNDGVEIEATLTEEAVIGSLTLADGERLPFTAKRIVGDSPAGIYRAETPTADGTRVSGWIVDTNGEIVGCSKGKARRALPPGRIASVGRKAGIKVTKKAPSPPKPAVIPDEEEDSDEPAEEIEVAADGDEADLEAPPAEENEKPVKAKKVKSAKVVVKKSPKKQPVDAEEESEEEEKEDPKPSKSAKKKPVVNDDDE